MNDHRVCALLFVDPNPYWTRFAVRTLKTKGIGAMVATDLDQAERLLAKGRGPQLAFVDLGFTERTPQEFRHFAQEQDRQVVVLLSTAVTPYQMSQLFRWGAYDCRDKPHDAESLIKLVHSLTRELDASSWNGASPGIPNCVSAT